MRYGENGNCFLVSYSLVLVTLANERGGLMMGDGPIQVGLRSTSKGYIIRSKFDILKKKLENAIRKQFSELMKENYYGLNGGLGENKTL